MSTVIPTPVIELCLYKVSRTFMAKKHVSPHHLFKCHFKHYDVTLDIMTISYT